MLTGYRLLREITAEEAKRDADNVPDTLMESIRSMREAGNVPDPSEPANGGGGNTVPADTLESDEPCDPDAPRLGDYADAAAYLADLRAHKAVPMSHLTIEQRRDRFASSRRV
jgi:hypothetical protein